MQIRMDNYLDKLGEEICIHGLSKILQELHERKKNEILPEIKKRAHPSTYYYWLSGKSPIKIQSLRFLSRFDPSLFAKAFSLDTRFSAHQKKCVLPKEMDSDLAYLLGAIDGDGHIHKTKYEVQITGDSKEYFSVISKLFKSLFGIDSHLIEEEKFCRIYIASKPVHSFLSIFHVKGNKTGKLKIPEVILENRGLLKEYLAGLFDTDGCLSRIDQNAKQRYFSFAQKDKRFTFEVHRALLKLGINANKPRKQKFNNTLGKTRKNELWRIYIGGKKDLLDFLQIISFRHAEKKHRAKLIQNSLGVGLSRIELLPRPCQGRILTTRPQAL